MLGLGGLGQSALGALPPNPASATVAFFRNKSWHAPYGLIGVRATSPKAGVIRTGRKAYLRVPCDCNIVGMYLVADQVGSIVADVLRSPAGAPLGFESITFGSRPTLASAQSIFDRTLLDWATALANGDVLAFDVLSCSVITNFTLGLLVDHV